MIPSLRNVLTMADRMLPARPGVTVLIYHRVGGGTASAVDISVAQFAEQLDTLVDTHHVISLDQAVERLRHPAPGGPTDHAVVITVDDGAADFCDHTLPALLARRLPVTLYLTTASVDGMLPWGVPAVSWAELADAHATADGLLTIGAHSHRHELFGSMSRAHAAADLDQCNALINDRLGIEVQHFAYPKAGPPSAPAETVVRQRYASAALAGSRTNRHGADLHRLHRTPIQRHDTAQTFSWKVRGGGRVDGAVRSARTTWRSARVRA
jgi:peptidoglycan/xylan/chitin deacetylase (PgdA/CDA1 family)